MTDNIKMETEVERVIASNSSDAFATSAFQTAEDAEVQSLPAQLSHGYNAHANPQNDVRIDPNLRASHDEPPRSPNSSYPPPPNPYHMMSAGVPQTADQAPVMTGPPDPNLSLGMARPGDGVDGRKAKRELSQSKRAAQNRAAQRAFRQRKEGHIKTLEQRVKDYEEKEAFYKQIEAENFALRDYVITLQTRLVDVQGEYPMPPSAISLGHHMAPPHGPHATPDQPAQQPRPASPAAGSGLEAVARAVEAAEQQQSYAEQSASEAANRQLHAEASGVPRAPM